MDVRVGPQWWLSIEELMLLNCGLREDLRVPWIARWSNQSTFRKSTLNISWKDRCLSWSSNTLATWCKELTHLKRPWCWKDWRQEKGMTENEMIVHRLNEHEFEQALGDGEGQGSLECWSSCSCKESVMTEWLKDNETWRASLVAQIIKNLPTMQVTQIQSVSQEDPLKKRMAIDYSILACRIQWTEKPGRLQSMDSQSIKYDWATNTPPPIVTVHAARWYYIPRYQ